MLLTVILLIKELSCKVSVKENKTDSNVYSEICTCLHLLLLKTLERLRKWKYNEKNAANCCKTPLPDLENVLIIGQKY